MRGHGAMRLTQHARAARPDGGPAMAIDANVEQVYNKLPKPS